MAEKGELADQSQEVDNHLTTDAPPSYSEATVSYGSVAGNLEQTGKDMRPLEDQIIVTLKEVNTAIAQNAPRTALTSAQRETIKRLTESILKRNVREQGVLPTALQREITLAHVVTKFNKTRQQDTTVSPQVISQPPSTTSARQELFATSARQELFATSSRPLILSTEASTSNLTSGHSSITTSTPQPQVNGHNPTRRNSFSSVVISHPQLANTGGQVNDHNPRRNSFSSVVISHPEPIETRRLNLRPKRVVIGEWLSYAVNHRYAVNNRPTGHVLAYSDQVRGTTICVSVFLVICFLIATPFSLIFTVPALCSILKVWSYV